MNTVRTLKEFPGRILSTLYAGITKQAYFEEAIPAWAKIVDLGIDGPRGLLGLGLSAAFLCALLSFKMAFCTSGPANCLWEHKVLSRVSG